MELTQGSYAILSSAHVIARRLVPNEGVVYVSTLHVLLAMCENHTSVASAALRAIREDYSFAGSVVNGEFDLVTAERETKTAKTLELKIPRFDIAPTPSDRHGLHSALGLPVAMFPAKAMPEHEYRELEIHCTEQVHAMLNISVGRAVGRNERFVGPEHMLEALIFLAKGDRCPSLHTLFTTVAGEDYSTALVTELDRLLRPTPDFARLCTLTSRSLFVSAESLPKTTPIMLLRVRSQENSCVLCENLATGAVVEMRHDCRVIEVQLNPKYM